MDSLTCQTATETAAKLVHLPCRLAVLLVAWVISLPGTGTDARAASDFLQYRSSGSVPEFGADYPKWQPKKSGSPFNVLSLTRPDNQCFFDLDASDAPLEQYQAFVQKYMKDQGATVGSTNPLSYELKSKDGKYSFVARTRGMDCGKKSYLATLTCLRDNYDQPTADTVFASMQCEAQADTKPTAPPTTGR